MKHFAKNSILDALWCVTLTLLMLTLWLTASVVQASDELPVMPRLVWNEVDQQLIATVPPAVLAWANGELEDRDGRYESWMERYNDQRRKPAFGAALFELQSLVRASVSERQLDRFQVEKELLPALLRERSDLARALAGEPGVFPDANPRCYLVEDGTTYCANYGGWCCLSDPWTCCCSWGCDTQRAGDCQVTTPIDCPVEPDDPNTGKSKLQRE